MASKTAIFDSSIAHFRLAEAGKPDATGLAIEVHIIAPGQGSSGYYYEKVLKKACESGVYPVGMHMHWDHPTATQEQEQPARSLKDLVGVLTEAGRYLIEGWDKTPDNPTGAGVYAKAKIFPDWVEKVRAMDGQIGLSHYVSGIAEDGPLPNGKNGRIITELIADPLNTVDFVTVPGAGGHYRTLFSEMKVGRANPNPTENKNNQGKSMADDKQESLTLSEIRTKHPEVVAELKKQLSEELKSDMITRDQTQKLNEAAGKIKTLEQENTDLIHKIAEGTARDIVTKAIADAKLPEASGKILAEVLIKQVVFAADHSVDAVAFGKVISEAIASKKAEIEALMKEAGISHVHDNGIPPAGTPADEMKAREEYRDTLLESGVDKEQANRLAGIEVKA